MYHYCKCWQQLKVKFISQLTERIPRVLLQLFKCFKRTTISKLLLPAAFVLFANFKLYLNAYEAVNVLLGSPLQYNHTLGDVFE